ncbi:lipase family protein [Streptomyces sp. NBC_00457]|uniref:esterase/lipase family protein n=1 Tax=unclassified Streptomyces TaxID=2593676 RepID=UPI002E1CA297|nr:MULTISPECIES: alpha/beta fold hydrolase [unclassified Streptomyces]
MSNQSPSRTRRIHTLLRLACVTALAAVALGLPSASSSAQPEPHHRFAAVDDAPPAPPLPGANDWRCRPTRQHPEPVVLVHGLYATPDVNWPFVSENLHKAGFCVYALTWGTGQGKYPLPGVAPLEESAKDLKAFVDRVRITTGSLKVDLVGHSAGGLMPRQYLRFEGGARWVDDFVALGPPNHGTTFHSPWHDMPEWVATAFCPSCLQFDVGSAFLTHLNESREVEPGVSYTTISTEFDEYILPYTSAHLKGASSQVTNVTVQDRCPDSTINHLNLAFDQVPLQWITNALQRPGPADPELRPTC